MSKVLVDREVLFDIKHQPEQREVDRAQVALYRLGLEAIQGSQSLYDELQAAHKTLQALGYTYHGGELWKPPLGKAPQPAQQAGELERDTFVVADRRRKPSGRYSHTVESDYPLPIGALLHTHPAPKPAQRALNIQPPNDVGETMCVVRWMAETPNGWVGSYDKAALEQFAAPQPAQQNDVEKEALLRALHAIDTVVVALPTFQVNTDGGIDAVAANIVTAIKSAADLLENGGAAHQPAQPELFGDYAVHLGTRTNAPQPAQQVQLLTDEEAKALLAQSDLLDMFQHIGWYSSPASGFKKHGSTLMRAIEQAVLKKNGLLS